MLNIFSRFYQKVLYLSSYLLNFKEPQLFFDEDSFADKVLECGHKKVLLVAGKTITRLNLFGSLVNRLQERGIEVVLFNDVSPNPTIANVEAGLTAYKTNACEAIIAFGGGSNMDCAKIIAARAVKPNKSVKKMQGLFKILKKVPDIFAVPTTAGTGSETTIASVITDENSHHKYAINDLSLIPPYALLDAKLTLDLPKHITSTTGMDALCHAIEAYIGKSNTKKTREASIKAVKLIFENLYTAYEEPSNLIARENMLNASYLAGIAFTRAYVGYVHALSHAVSGQYGTAHGLANAVLLPVVLKYYGDYAVKPLAKLAKEIGISGDSDSDLAGKFIRAIFDLNESMQIPTTLKIEKKDFEHLVSNAHKEAVPLYPVPKILKKEDLLKIYSSVMQ